jgi:hypothetical protein
MEIYINNNITTYNEIYDKRNNNFSYLLYSSNKKLIGEQFIRINNTFTNYTYERFIITFYNFYI